MHPTAVSRSGSFAPFHIINQPQEGAKAKVKYKKSMLRRGILAGAMVLAGCGATVAVAAAPAGASNTEMTGVGSFTTYFMMHALFPEINLINPLPEANTSETQSIAPDSSTCCGWRHVHHDERASQRLGQGQDGSGR